MSDVIADDVLSLMEPIAPEKPGDVSAPAPTTCRTTIESAITDLVSREVALQFKEALEQAGKYADEVYRKAFESFKADVVGREVARAVLDAKFDANVKTTKEIESRFNLADLVENIGLLPRQMTGIRNKMGKKRQDMRGIRQALADADLTVKETEAALLHDIIIEVNYETGKPMFSNDKARQAELMARKKVDDDYLTAMENYNATKRSLESVEDEMFSLEGKLKEVEMEFQGACKVLDAVTAEMNIYAQICGNYVTELAPSIGFTENSTIGNTNTNTNNEEGEW